VNFCAESTTREYDVSILNIPPGFHVERASIHSSSLMDFVIIINLQFPATYMYGRKYTLKGSDDGIYTHNNWVTVICPSSGILNTRKHNVSKTESVSVLR
jgi:hypothetical protein